MIAIKEMKLDDSYKIYEIDRSEQIELVYTYKEGALVETKTNHECPNWGEEDYREIITRFEHELINGGTAYGAFDGDQLVGFGVLGHTFRGKAHNQLQVDLMYVTRKYRRQGIGRRIMDSLSKKAIERGAEYLYISSTETESAVKFYSSCGSTLTSEIDEELFQKEPFDIHMHKKL